MTGLVAATDGPSRAAPRTVHGQVGMGLPVSRGGLVRARVEFLGRGDAIFEPKPEVGATTGPIKHVDELGGLLRNYRCVAA